MAEKILNYCGKPRISKMEGNVVDLLRRIADDKDALFKYFYWDCRVWHEIQDHILKAKPCLLVDLPDMPMHYYRGQGPISWKGAHTYAMNHETKPPTPPKVFAIEFAIAFDDKDEDRVRGIGFTLQVPVVLADDALSKDAFKALFNNWIAETAKQNEEKRRKKDLPKLEKLIKQYPKDAKNFLKK